MKYLTVFLLFLSVNTFAQDVDIHHLFGTWQCVGRISSQALNLKEQQKFTVTYHRNGHYSSTHRSEVTMDNEYALLKYKVSGQWKIEHNIFSASSDNISYYTNTNTKLEKEFEFEKILADKEFYHYRIIELSNTDFKSTAQPFDEYDDTKSFFRCKKISNEKANPPH